MFSIDTRFLSCVRCVSSGAFFITVMILLSTSVKVMGYGSGITGRSTTGCTSCHSGTSANTTISFTGNTTVNAGSSATLSLVVQNSSRPRAGFDMDFVNSTNTQISGLAVVSGQGAYMSGNEMTHSTAKTMSGGQATWNFTLNAPSTPGLYTIRVAGNATQNGSTGDSKTSTQTIIVKGLTLSAPSVGSSSCVGGVLAVQWNSYGVTTVNVQLSSDGGVNYSTVASPSATNGANTYNYTIPASTTPGTTYRVRVVDANDASLLSAMTGDFTITTGTSIVTQPTPPSRTVCQGSTASYTVVGAGTSLTYQWRKDGTNIAGATSAILTMSNVSSTQAGSYDCVVNGSCGAAVTSVTVSLSVDPATAISTQPSPQTACEGSPATFSITATGNTLQYQWKKAGTDIPGATRSTLSIVQSTPTDAGSYTCTVTGACGNPVTSSAAALTVVTTPVFTVQPKDVSQCAGSVATLSATVANSSGLVFEWLKDGSVVNASARVTGVNTLTLSIASLQASDNGVYQVRAFAQACQANVNSSTAMLVVQAAPVINSQPQSKTVPAGSSVSFSVSAAGTGLSYQWKKNNAVIAGATTDTYTISSVSKADEASYAVAITSSCGTTTSAAATLTVSVQPKPVLSVSQAAVDFGTLKIGVPKKRVIDLRNTGTDTLRVSAVTITGADATSFASNVKTAVIAPGGTTSMELSFSATKLGAQTAGLSFTSNDDSAPSVALIGNGVLRALGVGLVVMKDSVLLGSQADTLLCFRNQTSDKLRITEIRFSGDAESFTADSANTTIVEKDSCLQLSLKFAPKRSGEIELSIIISHDQGVDTTIVLGYGKQDLSAIRNTEDAPIAAYDKSGDFIAINLPDGALNVQSISLHSLRGCHIDVPNAGQEPLLLDAKRCTEGFYIVVVETTTRHFSFPVIITR